MSKPPVSEQVQVNFRMPAELRDTIKAMAEFGHRSMNAEIIARLEQAFSTDENQKHFFATAIADALRNPLAEVHIHLDGIPPEQRDNPKWINCIEVKFQDGGYIAVPHRRSFPMAERKS